MEAQHSALPPPLTPPHHPAHPFLHILIGNHTSKALSSLAREMGPGAAPPACPRPGDVWQRPSRGRAAPPCRTRATAGNGDGDGFGQGLPCSKGPLLHFPREGGVEGRKARVYVLGSGNCIFPFEFHWSFLLLFALGNRCAGRGVSLRLSVSASSACTGGLKWEKGGVGSVCGLWKPRVPSLPFSG